jgi:hypothetical protein
VQSKEEIFSFLDYIKTCPLRSVKRNRFFLIKKFYFLAGLKANKASAGTSLNKA